jgi:hydrogenase maturation protease
MSPRVIALGQAAAGDDGVGFAILEELRRRGVPAGAELLRALDATALISLLETPAAVVLVDAVLGTPPGEVIELGADELREQGVQPVSSHGTGVAEAIGLARMLGPERISPSIRIVAVTIARPDRFRVGLSPAVEAAVGRAADRVLDLLGG